MLFTNGFHKMMIKKKLYKVKLRYGENPNQKAYYLTNSQSNLFTSQLVLDYIS